ncbi:MAG TPA: SAM-dependent methyltransferase [Opitutales bacterium]|nr:SAM-dependent methyltransferase [Opitutales bacterium]
METSEPDSSSLPGGAARAAFEAGRQATRAALALKCAELFPGECAITLEIGCGHGHYLAAYSEAHPEEVCVGVDLITKRVLKGDRKRTARGLERLHFVKAEALEFIDALPAHVSIARVFVLFPDPWPKTHHWKHRIVQQPLLDKLASRTRPGTVLCLRTDHEGYFKWMKKEVAKNPHWNADPSAVWPFEAPSFFQSLMKSWQSMVAVRITD